MAIRRSISASYRPTTNNQLRHYHISGATLNVDKDKFKKQIQERNAALELVNWDGDTREITPVDHGPSSSLPPPSSSRTLSFDDVTLLR
jgi:hypothetical protein